MDHFFFESFKPFSTQDTAAAALVVLGFYRALGVSLVLCTWGIMSVTLSGSRDLRRSERLDIELQTSSQQFSWRR